MVLEWLFREIKSNPTSRLKTKSFGIQYYTIGIAGCNIINISTDNTMQCTLPTQLIVFIYNTSETLYNQLSGLCKNQIILIVTEKKLPFILCLNHCDPLSAESSVKKIKAITQMKEIIGTLQSSLVETHRIIITEPFFSKLYS